MYIFFPLSLAGEPLNQQEVQSGKFIRLGKTVFTHTSLRILSRALYCTKNLVRARNKSSFWKVSTRQKGQRRQDLIEDRCVLSGRARFIRYFSRDLSTHSLILLRLTRSAHYDMPRNFHYLFLIDFKLFFSCTTLCARRRSFARAFSINRSRRNGSEEKRKREGGSHLIANI